MPTRRDFLRQGLVLVSVGFAAPAEPGGEPLLEGLESARPDAAHGNTARSYSTP